MRATALLFASCIAVSALASEPGQALDCSDMTLGLQGLSCVPIAPFPQPDNEFASRGLLMAVDNEGYAYVGASVQEPANAIEIRRSRNGGVSVELVARIAARWRAP